MTDKLNQLQKDFEAFREECIWFSIVLNTHQALYDADEATDKLLRETAGWFFYDHSRMSQEYSVILVCRLTEHSGKGSNRNLTTNFLVEQLRCLSLSTPEIEGLCDELFGYRDRVERSRRKLVAHRDLRAIRNPREVESWPMHEVLQFLVNLNAFCDAVARQIGCSPSDFLCVPGQGDATDLIRVLCNKSQS